MTRFRVHFRVPIWLSLILLMFFVGCTGSTDMVSGTITITGNPSEREGGDTGSRDDETWDERDDHSDPDESGDEESETEENGSEEGGEQNDERTSDGSLVCGGVRFLEATIRVTSVRAKTEGGSGWTTLPLAAFDLDLLHDPDTALTEKLKAVGEALSDQTKHLRLLVGNGTLEFERNGQRQTQGFVGGSTNTSGLKIKVRDPIRVADGRMRGDLRFSIGCAH